MQEIRNFRWHKVLDYGLCTVRYQYHIRNNNNGCLNYVENTLLGQLSPLFTLPKKYELASESPLLGFLLLANSPTKLL